jgi:hypothetical protein
MVITRPASFPRTRSSQGVCYEDAPDYFFAPVAISTTPPISASPPSTGGTGIVSRVSAVALIGPMSTTVFSFV